MAQWSELMHAEERRVRISGKIVFGSGVEFPLSGDHIAEITIDEASRLQEEGIISGGMIPKIECCVEAIREGVKNVIIMDGRVPHSILMELLTDEGAGTMVTGGEK